MPSDLSIGEKAAVAGKAAFRTVEGAAQKHRWTRGLWAGAAATARSLWQTARAVFLEIVGVFFIFFAGAGAIKTYYAWQNGSGRNAVAGGVVFTAVFLYFGITSFWRARRR